MMYDGIKFKKLRLDFSNEFRKYLTEIPVMTNRFTESSRSYYPWRLEVIQANKNTPLMRACPKKDINGDRCSAKHPFEALIAASPSFVVDGFA